MRLQRKSVLVTDAASGIGYAIATLFAQECGIDFASDITPPLQPYPEGVHAITLAQ